MFWVCFFFGLSSIALYRSQEQPHHDLFFLFSFSCGENKVIKPLSWANKLSFPCIISLFVRDQQCQASKHLMHTCLDNWIIYLKQKMCNLLINASGCSPVLLIDIHILYNDIQTSTNVAVFFSQFQFPISLKMSLLNLQFVVVHKTFIRFALKLPHPP